MDLDKVSFNGQIVDMTEDEDTMAVEAHVRALVLLEDALKKKEWLLLDREIEYEKSQELNPNCPFLHQQLVLNLFHKLQEVQLLKNGDSAGKTYVYPNPDSVNIFLGQSFWESKEYLDQWSRPGTLILAASQILGYRNVAGTLTASDIYAAFETWMNHNGIYKNGIYTCCGEALRDSVCKESSMSHSLLPYMNEFDETDLKKATLDILWDCQKKCLLVEHIEKPQALLAIPEFPIITTSLVQELIEKLKQVKFKCDTRADKIAYTDPRTRNIIYVGNHFWKQKDYLSSGSRLGTIILYVAQLLEHPHLFDGATKDITSETTVEHQGSNSPRSFQEPLNESIHNHDRDPPLPLKNSTPSNIGDSLFNKSKSETYGKCKHTADTICAAFEKWMSHKGSYENESYTCCMETARHSVCNKSVMRSCLSELESRLKDFV